MKPSSFALLLLIALWGYSLIWVPTFDLDESLYRRVAEELKRNDDFWHPVWDGRALHHKPPFFYGLIALFSRWLDGVSSGVGIASARLPSLLSSIAILFTLGRFSGSHLKSVLIWSCAIFPVLTSTAVLFDPLQCLALLPSLLIPHRAHLEERPLRTKEWIWISLSMTASSLIKGLTGIILPSLAIAFHCLITDRKNLIRTGIQFTLKAFLPALILTGISFWFLDLKMGRGFTEEFFLTHHLGRGTQAMETHHGPVFYYIPVILLGGGFLIPFLVHESLRTRFQYSRFGFPLTFAGATLAFFSISATKLPHYTWPIWPALALQTLTLIDQPDGPSRFRDRSILWKIFLIPILLLGVLVFYFIFHAETLISQTVVEPEELFLLSVAGTLCLTFSFLFFRFKDQLEKISIFSLLISLTLAIPASQIAKRILVDPFFEVAEELKKNQVLPHDCIRFSGPQSATLSLALGKVLGPEFTHSRCEPSEMKYLVAPTPKKAECAERKMSILLEGRMLTLCGK